MQANQAPNSQLIKEDLRGGININIIGGMEIAIIHTKAGFYRAGDYHSVVQYSLVLKGEIEITLRQNHQDIIKKYRANEFIIIPANIPHLYKSIVDSIMVEWLAGPFKPMYYEPYRKIVKRQLK